MCVGDLANELEKIHPEAYIEEFVSGGPKNYAFRVFSPTDGYVDVCKVKGITLNYENTQVVNFSSMRDMILNKDGDDQLIVSHKQFRRTNDHSVITINQNKVYKLVSHKRRFFDDGSSAPYGHEKRTCEETSKEEN